MRRAASRRSRSPARSPRAPAPAAAAAAADVHRAGRASSRSRSPARPPARSVVLRDADGKHGRDRSGSTRAGQPLFRDVPPGAGYVVSVGGTARRRRSPSSRPTTRPPQSLYTGAAPRRRLRLPQDARRHAAVDQREPARARPTRGPTPPSSSTRATTRRTPTVDAAGVDGRAAARLRDRRREPARHRLLGRRVRLLRDRSQSLDGYDVIETVAAQPWVAQRHGRHGRHLVPGHHAAVRRRRPGRRTSRRSRRSRCSTTPTTRCIPGGIFNDGFALGWAKDRQADARPRRAPARARGGRASASPTATRRAATTRRSGCSRPTCSREIARQRLPPRRGVRRARARRRFVHDIDVPVFLAGSWQDEETGSHFADMLGNFSPDIPVKVTLMNGLHQDSLGPAVLVAVGRVPRLLRGAARSRRSRRRRARSPSVLLEPHLRRRASRSPPDRFTDQPDYASALRALRGGAAGAGAVRRGAAPRTARRCRRSTTTASAWPLPDTDRRPRGTSAPTARSRPSAPDARGDRRSLPRTTRRRSRARCTTEAPTTTSALAVRRLRLEAGARRARRSAT